MQPQYAAIAIAALGVVSSLGTAYITALGTAKRTAGDTVKNELIGLKLDQRSGAFVGEIRAFAFGGDYNDTEIKELRNSGWVECAGQVISGSEYPRLFALLQSKKNPWGETDGRPRLPDLRGMFLRGWLHDSEVLPDVAVEASARRSLYPSGSKGNKVGSYEEDRIKSHTHPIRPIEGPKEGFFEREAHVWHTNQPGHAWKMKLIDQGNSGDLAGGKKETAPKNVFVMYCIYTGTSDTEITAR